MFDRSTTNSTNTGSKKRQVLNDSSSEQGNNTEMYENLMEMMRRTLMKEQNSARPDLSNRKSNNSAIVQK